MPGGDRTGPNGEGLKTGKQLGYCAGMDQPGFAYQNEDHGKGLRRKIRGGLGQGRGAGFRFRHGHGRGAGFGFRHGQERFYGERSADVSEKTLIENEIRILKDQLSTLELRLAKIGKD